MGRHFPVSVWFQFCSLVAGFTRVSRKKRSHAAPRRFGGVSFKECGLSRRPLGLPTGEHLLLRTLGVMMLRATAVRRFAALPIVPIIGAFLAKKAVASYAIFNAVYPVCKFHAGRTPSTRRLLDGLVLVSDRATHRCTRTASRSSSDRSRTRRERGAWMPRRGAIFCTS